MTRRPPVRTGPTCAEQHCTAPSHKRGWCTSHWPPTIEQRFHSFIDVQADTDCWTWTGAAELYGKFKMNGQTRRAHRVSYELHIGPIPDGLEIDHTCGNTLCVNPDHLEATTKPENIHRSNGAGAHNGRKTHCPRGHEYTPENTYRWPGAPGSSRQCRACKRVPVKAQ